MISEYRYLYGREMCHTVLVERWHYTYMYYVCVAHTQCANNKKLYMYMLNDMYTRTPDGLTKKIQSTS